MRRREAIERILGVFDEFEGVDGNEWSQDEWTRRILTALCGAGQAMGYVCACDAAGADSGKWLYDLCWLDVEQGLRSVPMVAECKWGHVDEIEAGFHKLLVARASLRVLVCDGGRLPGGEQSRGRATLDRLSERVRRFRGSRVGDTYLLIVYEWHGDRRRSWRYRLRVNAPGKLPTSEPLWPAPARPQ